MSWVTIIWSMVASACLTLAVIYCLVWFRSRRAWANLFFALTAASTTALAFSELWMMRAETPAELFAALTFERVSLFVWVVSIIWFVRFHLGAGRLWIAWTISGLWAFGLLGHLLMAQDVSFRELTRLWHIQFLGESIAVGEGGADPLAPFTQFATLLVILFVADASVTTWRRGDRRKALMVGGSVAFLLVAGLGTAAAIVWAGIRIPMTFTLFALGLVTVMGYELSRDLLRASQLVRELRSSEAGLRESEARMSLAVDAAELGIWIVDLTRHQVWASEKWRALFGFGPSETVEFDGILKRLHPDDRQALQHVHAMALAGADGSTYQTEHRVMLPEGATRWMSSNGRVEHDTAGRSVLIRGTSRDITARKRAELVLLDLGGRLIAAQEVERARIARDLHDDVSQQIAALSIALSSLKRRAATIAHGTELEADASSLQQRATTLANSVQVLSHDLHPDVLRHVGLAASLTTQCNELSLSQGLATTCSAEGDFESIDPEAALCLYRITEEALHNVVKHAHAHEAKVLLIRNGDNAELTIADDGNGFDIRTRTSGTGIGLVSIAERARLLGGTVSVLTTLNKGTQVRVRIPIHASTTTDAGELSQRLVASA